MIRRLLAAAAVAVLVSASAIAHTLESIEAARYIKDVRVMTISPGTVTGHASAGGGIPSDIDFLNREIAGFLDVVSENGKKLN
jgi:homoserine O-acetyltransferase